MDEILQEFVNSRGVDVRVDRERGIIRGVKLLGLQSRNGRKYLPAALADATGLYEGAKVNVNHPKGSPLAARDYQDRLGCIRQVMARSGEGLFGDLHFNPKHALAEQLLWDATNAPENVGFSHNVEARTSRQGNETVVEAILRVQSVDLVADPATTSGLYESAGPSGAERDERVADALAGLTLDQLRAARPDLVDALGAAVAARASALEAEVDRLRVGEALHERRAMAERLLREFKLPDPEATESAARAIVSDLFLETLLAAPNEPAMRALVQERANMIATARKLERAISPPGRPMSREQNYFEPEEDIESEALRFARAIL
jgi:hypothetical protein